jgi:hypothetical protein
MPTHTPTVGTPQESGHLVVKEITSERDKQRNVLLLCDCRRCGGTTKVTTARFLAERTKSCGCLPSKEARDRTGEVFGLLTVLEMLSSRDKHGRVLHRCKCKCGNETTVAARDLVTRNTKSCGCQSLRSKIKSEHHAKRKFKNNGVEVLAPRLAEALTGFSTSTLRSQRNSARLLPGEGLGTEPLASAFGRMFTHFEMPQLKRLNEAWDALPIEPTARPGTMLLPEARAILHLSNTDLYKRLREENIEPTKNHYRDGRQLRRFSTVPLSFVRREAARKGIALPPELFQTEAGNDGASLIPGEFRQPEQDTSKGSNANKGGRPRTADKKKKICWEIYTSDLSMYQGLTKAKELLKDDAPDEWGHLRWYAHEYATDNKLEWVTRNQRKSP